MVLSGGVVQSLSATGTFSFMLAGATFASPATATASPVNIAYASATQSLAVSGSASLVFPNSGPNLSLTLGTQADPGLVFSNGALTSLNATASFSMSLAGASFSATALNVTYAAAAGNTPDQFTVTGDASLTAKVGSSSESIAVDLGGGSTTGLVLSGGVVQSLNATATFSFMLAGATFASPATATASPVNIAYASANQSLAVSGSASLVFPNSGPNLSLTLGTQAAPGLVFSNGALSSLNATTTIDLTLAGGTFSATDVNITYAAAGDSLSVSGSATLDFPSGTDFSLTLGTLASPGLVFSGGALSSLNATAGLNATIASVSVSATALNVTYAAAAGNTPDEFTVTGDASLNVKLGGTTTESIGVDFGGGSTTGLVLSNGKLQSLNMTLNANLVLGGVTFATSGLIITDDTAATNPEITITGDSSFTVGGISKVQVDFGGTGTQGLVITNGALSSLNMTVTSSLTVGGFKFETTGLVITDDVSASTFTMTGAASFTAGSLANIQVQFGPASSGLPATNGNAPSTGLVITNGSLTNLDMTVNSTITEAGVTLTADDLHLVYNTSASPATFSLSGSTTATFPGLGSSSLNVTLGTTENPSGLVIQGSTLVSLGMAITSNLTIDGATFTANDLAFDYTASSNLYQLTGTTGVTVGGVTGLNVTFGTSLEPDGLVVQNGSLASLGVVVNGGFSVDSVAFTASGLELDYTADPQSVQLVGSAGVSVKGTTGGLNVTFAGQGLVIANGTLQSLDMTVNSSFTVSSVVFAATGLNFDYTAGTDGTPSSFSMTGTVGVTVGGVDNLSVTFGSNGEPGLVITGGSLVSLNMTINTKFDIASVEFDATNLNFDYVAGTDGSDGSFSMAGSVSVTVGGLDDSLSVMFGYNGSPGLVITNGSLTSLNMTINATFDVASVAFNATNLNFVYRAGTNGNAGDFSMAGTVGVTVGGLDSLSVTFGDPTANPLTDPADYYGLVIDGGSLVSLNMTINTQFTVAGVAFNATNLNFDYVAATDRFSMAGNVSVTVGGLGDSLSVTFGDSQANPVTDPDDYYGLIIQNGSLVSLNMFVTANFSVDSVTFDVTSLNFDYVAATDRFSMAGSVSVTVGGLGDSLAVTFGDPQANPVTDPADHYGLIIQNGSLVSLNMFVTADFNVDAVTIEATNLNFDYVVGTNGNPSVFSMAGTVGVSFSGDNLSVTFGDPNASQVTDPAQYYGLIIDGGSLTHLDATVNASFKVDGVTIVANGLDFDYTDMNNTKTFTLTGSAGVDLPGGIGMVDVTFGDSSANPQTDPAEYYGLDIVNGSLVSLDMTISASFAVGSLTLGQADLQFMYTAATDEFTMSGMATADLDLGGAIDATLSVDLGGTTAAGVATQGLVVQNGELVSLNMSVSGSFSVFSISLSQVDFVMSYTAATDTNGVSVPSEFIMSGSASLDLYNVITLNINLGQNGAPGLVVEGGTLETFDFSVDTSISFLGLLTASLDVSASYSANTGILDFQGTAGLGLDWSTLPKWMHPFWGGTLSLGQLGFEISVDTNNESNSFVDFSASVADVTVGVEIGFNGSINLSFGDPRQVMPYNPNATWDQSAASLAQTYQAASNGLGTGYNITPSELNTYGGAQVAQATATAIAQGHEDNWGYHASLGDLEGATALYDPTGTGAYQAGDLTTTTAADGGFNLPIPAGSTSGEIVVTGGTDLSTGLPNQLVLTAPLGATQVNPFTTLLTHVMQIDPSLTESSAITRIDQSLGLPSLFDFTQEDYLDGALLGNGFDAAAFALDAKIAATANMVVGMLGGLKGAAGVQSLGNAFWSSLASAIDKSGGTSPVNLDSTSQDQALLQATATAAGLTLPAPEASGASTVMAAVDQAIDAQSLTGTSAYLSAVIQIQTLAQGTIAPALAQVAAGTSGISTVVGTYTEANVTTLAVKQVIGPLTEPAVAISSVAQGVGTGQPSTFQFTVTLTGTPSPLEPVSISYTTVDGSATAAAGDYTPVTGTLTWAPGDTSPQAITVPVTDVPPGSDAYFLVELSKPVNTEVHEANGVGAILVYSEYATTTKLTASTLSTPSQAPVTLTAVVTNQDGSKSPGVGQVDFFDGSTDLGSVTLNNAGLATLTTSFINLGSHPITAVYDGYQTVGDLYDQSTSPVVAETITPATQTITFSPIHAQTYGELPITLEAASSLYLPVSFSVISGPATLSGDVLTITGAGTVVVAATQPGNADTEAATPVDQSLQVARATLTISAGYQTAAYGAAFPTLAAFYNGFVSGDTAASLKTLPILSTTAAGSGVGSYAINASGAVDSNYTITYVPGALTITPALLNVSPNNLTVVYGAAYPSLAATFAGAASGDISTLSAELKLTTAPAGSSAGTHAIDASGITDPNYTVDYAPGTLTITPAPLTITANGLSAFYGAVPALTASYKGLVNGDTVASLTVPPVLSLATPETGIGTYKINAVGAIDPNYTVNDISGTLTVEPAPLTITANSQTIAYGAALPTLSASYSGLANGDTPGSLTTPPTLSLPSSASDAGSYSIKVSGAADPNYAVSYVSGTLTITPDATATTITPSVTAPLAGQVATYTASVTAGSAGLPVTVGSVQFEVDGQDLGGPVALDANGDATLDPGALPLGSHTITAIYDGTTDDQTGSQTLSEVVSSFGTTTRLSSSESVANHGAPFTFTAIVAVVGPTGGTPTGSVQFDVDGQPSGSPVTLGGNGEASLTLSTLGMGVHTITAIYSGQGSTFQAGDTTTTIVVSPANQTITFGPLAGETFGAGPITLEASSGSGLAVAYSVISGPATLNGSTLTITGAGTIIIEADQAGNVDYLAAAPVRETLAVAQATPTIS